MILGDISPKKAALYVRVSTEEQAKEGYSIAAQIETLEQYCRLYGMEVAGIYRDLGISGKSMQERPALLALLQDSATGAFDSVLVWKVSRLSRNLKDLLAIVDELKRQQVAFISYSERFDTSTAAGRMTMQLLGSIAEFERSSLIDNVRLGLSKRARCGQWTNNHVYGYDNRNKKLVVNPREAEVVRQIYALFLEQDMGVSAIADLLNQQGLLTKRNNLFTRDAVYRILSNPVYCGFIRHNVRNRQQAYRVQGTHQPLVEVAAYEAVQKKLGTRSSLPRDSGSFPLAGILKCPGCGSAMKGSTTRYKDREYRYYKCSRYDRFGSSACSSGLIKAGIIEGQVMDRLQALHLDMGIQRDILAAAAQRLCPDSSRNQVFSGSRPARKERKQLELLYVKYFRLFEAGSITEDQLAQRLGILNERSAKLKASEDQSPCPAPEAAMKSEAVTQWLQDIPSLLHQTSGVNAKRLLHSLLKDITLSPGTGYPLLQLRFPCDGKEQL